MRIAVISDVHGQPRPLQRAFDVIASHAPDEIWCLGDIHEAIRPVPAADNHAAAQLIRDRCDLTLIGNHDAWVTGQQVMNTTSAVRAAHDVRDWLNSLSARAYRHDVLCVHGSPTSPLTEFIDFEFVARANLKHVACDRKITVYGHTHTRRMWGLYREGRIRTRQRQLGKPENLGPYEKVMLNPGAICGPDPTWMLLDLADEQATWYPAA